MIYTINDKISFIKRALGNGKLSGKNLSIVCPNNGCTSNRAKYKLAIHIETEKNHCWVCGWKARTLLPLLLKFAKEYVGEYKEKFCDGSVINTAEEEQEYIAKLPKDFTLLAHKINTIDPDTKRKLNYLYKRGISESDLWYYKLGYSNEYDMLNRIIVPSFDNNGNLNYFTARSIDDNSRMKYVNCKVDKLDVVFNDIFVDWTKKVTLVEGPFDLFKAGDNATCLLGSEFNENSAVFNKILLNNTSINLALDDDMPGKQQKYARLLESYGIDVFIVNLKGNHDPGGMTKNDFSSCVNGAKKWDWGSYMMQKINSAISGTSRHTY